MKGYIYLIRNKELYKIGITKNIKQRFKALKPDEVIKVFQTNKYKQLEKKLHKKYKLVRIPQTEYFRLTPSMITSCKNELTNSYHMRAQCNPWLIAISTTLISPITCIIWGTRQRSYTLLIMPIIAIVLEEYIYSKYETNKSINLCLKLLYGVIAFIISKRSKEDTLKQ